MISSETLLTHLNRSIFCQTADISYDSDESTFVVQLWPGKQIKAAHCERKAYSARDFSVCLILTLHLKRIRISRHYGQN